MTPQRHIFHSMGVYYICKLLFFLQLMAQSWPTYCTQADILLEIFTADFMVYAAEEIVPGTSVIIR